MFSTTLTNRTESPSLTYTRCRVGGRDYGLNTIWILDIRSATDLTVDLQNSGQVGWVKTMGQEIPIYDLAGRMRLKRPRFDPQQHRIILINAKPHFGVLVESLLPATEISASHVYSLPDFARNPEKDYIEGVVVTADGLLPLLDPLQIVPLFEPDPLKQPKFHYPPAHISDLQPSWLNLIAPPNIPALATFSLAEQEPSADPILYGLSGSQLLDMTPPAYITALPASAPHVIGLTQWHGLPLPLIDAGALLGRKGELQLTKQKVYRFLIVRDKNGLLASLCVQDGVEVAEAPFASRQSEQARPYAHTAVRGLFEMAQQTVAVLDVSQLWAV